MRERPLCVFCLLFLIAQVVLIRGFRLEKDWYPSLLEKTVEEGSVLTTAGVVSHTEIKKDHLVVYLTAKSYQTNIIVYIKLENSLNQHISIGNEIEVTGEVAYFDEPRNPGNFDQNSFIKNRGFTEASLLQNIRYSILLKTSGRNRLPSFAFAGKID